MGGGNIHGIWKKKFYHGIRPFRVGTGDAHGIWKKQNYHGIRPFTVGGGDNEITREKIIMGYDPLGWGGGHSWNLEEKNYHGTQEGVLLGVPQYREARRGERG